jgi:hypothetical protein
MNLLIYGYNATQNAQVANTTVEGSLVGSGVGERTLRSDIVQPGLRIWTRLRGLLSTGAVPGNLTLRFKLGPTVILSETFLPTAALANRLIAVEFETIVRIAGIGGRVLTAGELKVAGVSRDFMTAGLATVDLSADRLIELTAQWQTALPGNDLRSGQFTLEVHRY